MGDKRQKFRIRLPWSTPSAPAPPPANITKRVPSRVTSTQNTAPASVSGTSTQPDANPTTRTAQRTPSRSPGVSQTQTPKPPPRSPTSIKTDTQPTTTESPDRTVQATNKVRITAPSSTAPLPTGESQSPSKTTPTPKVPHDQTSPLRSPKQFASQNSLPQAQASPETVSQPSSSSPAGFRPRNSTPTESTLPPPTSSKPPSPVSESQTRALSQPQPLEGQSMINTTDDLISKSPVEATNQSSASEALPSERSGYRPTKPAFMASKKPDETTSAVENQEMVAQEAPGPIGHTKEPFHKEEKKLETREILKKEVLNSNTPKFNGKQSKTMVPHQRNKNMVGEPRQKPMASIVEGVSMQKEIKNDISKFAHLMATKQKKPASVITLVGENKGATMQLGPESAKREAEVHIHRGYKLNSDESAEATKDDEESSQKRKEAEANTNEYQTTKAYMNSNTQGLNNSLLFNTSITERNPGVHFVLSRNQKEPIKTDNSTNNLEARKVEASITPSQKLTYEPTIRRRCLRGLLMESSDSEPDNPEKPSRHGCRCSYGDINKDNEIEVL